MSILKKILQIKKQKRKYLTVPSHAQKPIIKSILGAGYYHIDISEVDGFDNLNNPENCILEYEEKLSEIYNSGYSHILTNGATQGILALMLATLKFNDKVLCATNCHKSVHNGLILTGAEPIWVKPTFNNEYGVLGAIQAKDIEFILESNKDIKCVILTNPTYDGIISEISKISTVCKAHNVILIIDEAHGALWNFDKTIGTPAIIDGADASVQSLHKTCGAVNQTAIVHLSKNSQISKEKLLNALNLISTTSPSFPIVCNAEETINFLVSKNGKKFVEKLVENITQSIQEIKKLSTVKIYAANNDITRLLITTTHIKAVEAADILFSKFKIECEILHNNAMTFVCGVGTTKQNLKHLVKGLRYIDKKSKNNEPVENTVLIPPSKNTKILPAIAYNKDYDEVLPLDAVGKICAEIITPYPPGIPILSYGEVISNEHLNFINLENKIRIVK